MGNGLFEQALLPLLVVVFGERVEFASLCFLLFFWIVVAAIGNWVIVLYMFSYPLEYSALESLPLKK